MLESNSSPDLNKPDILQVIADLSNNEVRTPPDVANAVLDLLPAEIWSNPKIKLLDPACKTGVFLREAAKRFDAGLAEIFPDSKERHAHIFGKMLYGIALTQLSALMSRRTLYGSKDAAGKHSYSREVENSVPYWGKEGNIWYKNASHEWDGRGKCRECSADKDNVKMTGYDEKHCYTFIHQKLWDQASKSWGENMRFDVIVGNPPYQLSDGEGGKGSSSTPIYQLFVKQAKNLNPDYLTMIIPSRWFAGGKGLDSFRKDMLEDVHIDVLVDYPQVEEVFSDAADFEGGVCYFLWDKKTTNSGCDFTTIRNGKASPKIRRKLSAHDIFIRENEAVEILEKVLTKDVTPVSEHVSEQKPFGFRSDFHDFTPTPIGEDDVKLYATKKTGWVARTKVQKNTNWIDYWKVLTSKAYGERSKIPAKVISTIITAPPNSCCTETYLVMGVFKTEEEAENFANYMKTRMFRFLVSLRKPTQNMARNTFAYVPDLPMNRTWTDEDLYKRYALSSDEITFIESQVKEMS